MQNKQTQTSTTTNHSLLSPTIHSQPCSKQIHKETPQAVGIFHHNNHSLIALNDVFCFLTPDLSRIAQATHSTNQSFSILSFPAPFGTKFNAKQTLPIFPLKYLWSPKLTTFFSQDQTQIVKTNMWTSTIDPSSKQKFPSLSIFR